MNDHQPDQSDDFGGSNSPDQPDFAAPGSNPPAARPDGTTEEPLWPFVASTENQYATSPYDAQSDPNSFAAANRPTGPAQGGIPATRTRGRRRGYGLVSLAVVAVLAAGVGGGSGVLVDRALTSDQPAPVSSPASTESGGTTPVISSADWSATAQKVSPSVVAITVRNGQSGAEGSGVILDTSGNIVTNNHVVTGMGQANISVVMGDRSYTASVVGTDPSTDLAVIKLDNPPTGLKPISFADSHSLVVGQGVMAVGNPLGLSGTVTTGIISALNRPVTTEQVTGQNSSAAASGDQVVVTNAIQTSAAINPGNSGGALVNVNGELIGINSAIASLSSGSSSQSGNIGIGFAIPSDQVQYITDQLLSGGVADHAYLGIGASNGTVKTNDGVLLGAEVSNVVSGSSAAQAGIKVGDLITAIDSKGVNGSESLVGLIRDSRVGEAISVTLLRNGSETTVSVTLGKSPN